MRIFGGFRDRRDARRLADAQQAADRGAGITQVSTSGGGRLHAASPRFGEGGQTRVALPGYGKTYGVADENRDDQERGYCNTFTYYLQQISELYTMLEARTAYGAATSKAILRYRTSFLAGEGIRVSADTPELQDWCEGWLRVNGLTGRMLTDAVAESEVVGHCLFTIGDDGMIEFWPAFVGYDGWDGGWGIGPQHYTEGNWEQPEWWPQFSGIRLTGVTKRQTAGSYVPWLDAMRDRFTFVRTGGHGNVARYPAPTSVMAGLIDPMKNYERAVYQTRELNNEATRQSPTFELDAEGGVDEQEVADFYEDLQAKGWGMGDPVVTPGKFSITSSDSGPVDTAATEAALVLKILSGGTSIPPHWLGFVDLMSNRATAESLFETIKAGTLVERLAWEHGVDDMIRKARMVMGGPTGDFRITMPLLSYHAFQERNESMLALHAADVIGTEDVQGQLPFHTQHESGMRPDNDAERRARGSGTDASGRRRRAGRTDRQGSGDDEGDDQ